MLLAISSRPQYESPNLSLILIRRSHAHYWKTNMLLICAQLPNTQHHSTTTTIHKRRAAAQDRLNRVSLGVERSNATLRANRIRFSLAMTARSRLLLNCCRDKTKNWYILLTRATLTFVENWHASPSSQLPSRRCSGCCCCHRFVVLVVGCRRRRIKGAFYSMHSTHLSINLQICAFLHQRTGENDTHAIHRRPCRSRSMWRRRKAGRRIGNIVGLA